MKTEEREEFFETLERKQKERVDWDLKNTQKILKRLHNPEKRLKTIHIAGTNGKGSTAAFINQILITAGYKTGFYTSPHIIRRNERIKINNKEITDEELNKQTHKIKEIMKEEKITTLSFFEALTGIALSYFSEKETEIIILEAGLGGELDATNVCKSTISAITSIAKDHTKQLGNTIEQITKAKAGIIKEKQTCIVPETLNKISKKNIKKRCEEKKTVYKEAKKTEYKISLEGEFQKSNAGIAVAIAKELREKEGINITDEHIKEALQKTLWIGRLSWLTENIIIDAAHNLEAIKAVAPQLKDIQKKFGGTTLVFGACEDKNIEDMLNILIKELKPQLKEIILTEATTSRAESVEKLEKIITEKKDIIITKIRDHKKLWKILQQKQENELCIVTGSIYLLGDIIKAKE